MSKHLKTEGFTNFQTWQVALVFDNNFDLYQKRLANTKSIKDFVLANKHKDIESYKDVNWEELADHWKTGEL